MSSSKELEFALKELDELGAVLALEYHNKNWLAHDSAALNIKQRELVRRLYVRVRGVLRKIKEFNQH